MLKFLIIGGCRQAAELPFAATIEGKEGPRSRGSRMGGGLRIHLLRHPEAAKVTFWPSVPENFPHRMQQLGHLNDREDEPSKDRAGSSWRQLGSTRNLRGGSVSILGSHRRRKGTPSQDQVQSGCRSKDIYMAKLQSDKFHRISGTGPL